ncbi:MAG: translational activator of GCN4 [Alyxoria varia]|nr:MAG: translational activator of GCN4 [Alyxoria varia]
METEDEEPRRMDAEDLRRRLFTSSTKSRISELNSFTELVKNDELPPETEEDLLHTLLTTYSFYTDRPSRRAAQALLAELLLLLPPDSDISENTQICLHFLQREARKSNLAPGSVYVLVELGTVLLRQISVNEKIWDKNGAAAVKVHAQLLDRFLATAPSESRRKSVVLSVRSALRTLFTADRVTHKAAKESVTAIAAKGDSTPANAPYLGIIAGVAHRQPDVIRAQVAWASGEYYTFYIRDILGSKTILPEYVAHGLHDFFREFSTEQATLREMIPAFEKALLRAPEVVLNDLLAPFIESLPPEFDLSPALKKNLLKPLLSNIKSSNPAVREGSVRAFRSLARICREDEAKEQAATEILKNVKDAKAADQRLLCSQMLGALQPAHSLSLSIPQGLSPVAAKETNEAALASELEALAIHFKRQLSGDAEMDSSISKAIIQGLRDKKPTSRRIWGLHVGNMLWGLGKLDQLDKDKGNAFAESAFEAMANSWTEVTANPVPSTQSGLTLIALILSAFLLDPSSSSNTSNASKKLAIDKQLDCTQHKPSFLFNPRVFTRLYTADDFTWFTRALEASSMILRNASHATRSAWSQAMIFATVSSAIPHQIRKEANEALTRCYLTHPELISSIIIDGAWSWLKCLWLEEKDSPAMASQCPRTAVLPVFRALCVRNEQNPVPKEMVHSQLIRLLVLCRHPLVARISWIDTCIRMGVDPHELVAEGPHACIEEAVKQTTNGSDAFSVAVHQAACDAAAEVAFVAPEAITPLIVDVIRKDLDSSQLSEVGPTEAAIYRTPEGTAFIDVIAAKENKYVPDKNVKDYDTLQWEKELRDQLAKKQGQQKKLAPDEQKKVNAQLEKEAKIRQSLSEVVLHLHRGICIVHSLAKGPPTDVEAWLGPAAQNLLSAIQQGAGLIVGDAPVQAYLALSECVSSRLGLLRQSLGIATIRAVGTSQVPKGFTEEPLGDLVTRVLYRLRFSGEQRPFDPVSLLYILPFIDTIVSSAGIEGVSEEEADEQITLALEFLSFHGDQFSNTRLPRAAVLSLLVRSMQRFSQHYRLLKDTLLNISHVIGPDATEAEISVLLRASIVPESSVRTAALQAIDTDLDLPEDAFVEEIWLACHEDVEENADTAKTIWEENSLTTDPASNDLLIPYLESQDRQARNAASRALAECVKNHPESLNDVLSQLQGLYVEKAKPSVPERDAYGMIKKTDLRDQWEARQGIALAFQELAPSCDASNLGAIIQFFIERGPFADRHDAVREAMVDAATSLVTVKGDKKVEDLLKNFESTLDAPDSGSQGQDKTNEAVIILYGALARHLKAGDDRIPKIVDRLLTTLATPSENVQYAIAKCLPPLVQGSASHSSEYLNRVTEDLTNAKKYAVRRGAAYGLAGIVRGKGIAALREARIMSTLTGAMEEKKDANKRQGAFLAYELLSLLLGPTFEPYVIQIVPQLLAGFGDASVDVRDACLDASKTCFASMSSYGVKQILPTLLEGLDEQQWRSKKGACDLLGAMAYLDPQQLAVSLPDIIPPLTQVLGDSHKEVRGAANRSLQRFGEVISNPEVKSLVNVLLKALSDPTKYTDEALDSLLKVNFVHYLDAPSLALVTRILERGLGDRSATKRKSAQIIGSLAHLTDRKDMVSHLPVLVSGLRIAVVDPVPATRATASKALGSLVEKLGEEALPDLIPSLMATLKTDASAGDRLGSAQALSEVLAGLGVGRLEETLPSILQNVASTKAAVREGFISLFIFLPACFGNIFANYLSKIIPPILSGLADDVDSIRETSLRAGRLLVKNFATRAIDLLLPELQRGLGDHSYRIRLSSVELVGDLLFNLTGISGKEEEDPEEAEEEAKAAGQSLVEALGEEKRSMVLSALYISRCDTSGLVRAAAIQVWKALVATPRTLREITPTLTQIIISRLASPNAEQKHIASNALGELIRKAGEGVLANLLPTLEGELEASVDADAKQGICIALREVISSAPSDSLHDHEPKLFRVVRTALLDREDDVREAAAEAFDSLQNMLGKKVIDQILPDLLTRLRDPDQAENALSALLTLLTETTRSNVILPSLLPNLLTSPISAFNARALASLASVAGSSMTRRLSPTLNSLMDNIVTCKEPDRLEALEGAFDTVMLSVDEFDGLNGLMAVLLSLVKHDDHRKRRSADEHLANFFAKTSLDYSRYNADLIRALLISFDDRDADVVKAAWTALITLTRKLRKEEMESLVPSTRQVLGQVGVPGHDLKGFSLPKGVNAVLPIFNQGLVNGTTDQRVQSALAITDIIEKTNPDALKPFVTQITGPLIRVVSEKSIEVKAAILVTLNHLLEKIPTAVKPFLPQLQRTFTKALADPNSETLRLRSAKALGSLITLTPRIDPLIGELVTGAKTPDAGVRNAMQKALFEVIIRVGGNMSEASRNSIIGLIDDDTATADDDTTAITNARLLGSLIKALPHDTANPIIKSRILPTRIFKNSILAVNAVLLDTPDSLTQHFPTDTIINTITRGINNKDTSISENSILASGKYLLGSSSNLQHSAIKPLFEALAPVMQPGSPLDARRLALVVIRTISRARNDLLRPHLGLLVPPLFASVRDSVIPIKLAAEAAFLAIFNVVNEEGKVFEKYMSNDGKDMQPAARRGMQDYFKRVALRLAGQARERREAEGGVGGSGGLGLTSDEREDEREIWSVGKVELDEGLGMF